MTDDRLAKDSESNRERASGTAFKVRGGAIFSGAVVAVSEHDTEQKSAARWAASFVVASLVGAYFLWMLL